MDSTRRDFLVRTTAAAALPIAVLLPSAAHAAPVTDLAELHAVLSTLNAEDRAWSIAGLVGQARSDVRLLTGSYADETCDARCAPFLAEEAAGA
jgi:hypothetical protein